MARQLKEIKFFNKGIVSAPSQTDIPDEACSFSLDLEPHNDIGVLRGVNQDYVQYPKAIQVQDSNIPWIDKMEMLDLGKTEDLFLYASSTENSTEYGLNYIKDWYGAQTLGQEWHKVECSTRKPCFTANNKEFHIGFGSSHNDGFPVWMGYAKHKQFGKRVATGVMVEHAALKSPDHGAGHFALDKIIRIETDFNGQYEWNVDAQKWTVDFRRPYQDRATPFSGTVSNDWSSATRYHEDIGADIWLYGCQREEPYIYKVKMDNPANDSAATAGVPSTKRRPSMKEGDLIRSNEIVDNEGKVFPISSICASMRYKNCVWAVSSQVHDNRAVLINVNDYFNVNDPDDMLGNGDTTWKFDKSCEIIGEWVINLPSITTQNEENRELVPEGDWIFSDIMETFECNDGVHELNWNTTTETPLDGYWSAAGAGNGKIYDGAKGELLTCRLWVSLYKPQGFSFSLYNVSTIEPFVYSADIFQLRHSELGGVLDFVNQTIPMREIGIIPTVFNGEQRNVGVVTSQWKWRDTEGPYPFMDYQGWDEVKHISDGWLDAEDYEGFPSNQSYLSMGRHLGFRSADNVLVEVPKYPLAWTYGKAGFDFLKDINADGAAHNYDTHTWKENSLAGSDIHQVLVLCNSQNDWVYDGGYLFPKFIFFLNDTWVGGIGMSTVPLNKFFMLCSNKKVGEGYEQFYGMTPGDLLLDGILPNQDWRYPVEALSWKDSKVLYRLSDDFDDLEFDNIQSIQSVYNPAANQWQTEGRVQIWISEGVSADNSIDDGTLDETRLWGIEVTDGLYPNAGTDEFSNDREAEIQQLYPVDPAVENEADMHPKIMPKIGNATMCVLNADLYPMGEGNYDDWAAVPNTTNSLVFFMAACQGEYKNGVAFGASDANGADSSDGWWWDEDSSQRYFLGSGSNNDANTYWSGFEWPPNTGLTAEPLSSSGYPGGHLCIFEDDDVTLQFDNTATTTVPENCAYTWEQIGGDPTIIEYKMSYLYDGYQYSPLTQSIWRNELVDAGNNTEGITEVSIEMTLNPIAISKRVTHVQLWARTDKDESFKLVAQKSLKSGWIYDESLQTYKAIFTDDGNKSTGESYVAASNLPEDLKNMEIKYQLSAEINGYHIVGNCWHPDSSGMEFFLLRSEWKKYDQFNWANLWLKLPNIPVAMETFNGRLFVWDKHTMYRIDPNTFQIEDTFEGIGCCGPEAVCVTEFGMCFADNSNIYLHDGSNPTIIGKAIATAEEDGFGLDELSLDSGTQISFDQKRGGFMVLVKKGKEGQYTEGNELSFSYSDFPYIGYYHIKSDDSVWSGPTHTHSSIKLKWLTDEQIAELTAGGA